MLTRFGESSEYSGGTHGVRMGGRRKEREREEKGKIDGVHEGRGKSGRNEGGRRSETDKQKKRKKDTQWMTLSSEKEKRNVTERQKIVME